MKNITIKSLNQCKKYSPLSKWKNLSKQTGVLIKKEFTFLENTNVRNVKHKVQQSLIISLKCHGMSIHKLERETKNESKFYLINTKYYLLDMQGCN